MKTNTTLLYWWIQDSGNIDGPNEIGLIVVLHTSAITDVKAHMLGVAKTYALTEAGHQAFNLDLDCAVNWADILRVVPDEVWKATGILLVQDAVGYHSAIINMDGTAFTPADLQEEGST